MSTNWINECLNALAKDHLFESSEHRTRMKELLDCYSSYPFFSRGLCKCMYLSAWDEDHFSILLETLNDLALGKEPDTRDMSIRGDALAEEQTDGEYDVYRLSIAFLENLPYEAPHPASIPPQQRYIIERALKASQIIDRLPE